MKSHKSKPTSIIIRPSNLNRHNPAIRTMRSPLRDRYLTHYGIDSVVDTVFLNGEIMPQTLKPTAKDPLTGWQVYSHPQLDEVISKLRFLVKNEKAVKLLEEIGHSGYSIGDRIAVSKLLKRKSWAVFNTYPLELQLTPKLAFSFRLLGEIPDPDYIPDKVLSLCSFLVWNEQPAMARIGIDVYRLSHSHHIPQNIEALEQYRSRMRSERSHSVSFHKTRYVHATDVSTRIDSLNHDPDLRFRSGLAIVDLIPGKNKGSHIFKVIVTHSANGRVIPLGQVCHLKGKLYFSSPLLCSSEEHSARVESAKREYNVARERYNDTLTELQNQVKGINSKIEALQCKQHADLQSAYSVANKIERLKGKREILSQKIRDLNAPSIGEVESTYHRLPSDLVVGVTTVLRQLGLQPNHWLRSLPRNSPFNSPKFWGSKFGVVAYQPNREDGTPDTDRPLQFVKDVR